MLKVPTPPAFNGPGPRVHRKRRGSRSAIAKPAPKESPRIRRWCQGDAICQGRPPQSIWGKPAIAPLTTGRGTSLVHKTFSRICWRIKILDPSHFMKLLVRKIGIFLVGASITVPIVLLLFIAGVQAQPTTQPAIAPTPRLTLTAEQEYT